MAYHGKAGRRENWRLHPETDSADQGEASSIHRQRGLRRFQERASLRPGDTFRERTVSFLGIRVLEAGRGLEERRVDSGASTRYNVSEGIGIGS